MSAIASARRGRVLLPFLAGLAGAALVASAWIGSAAETPAAPPGSDPAPDGWVAAAVRDEIRPQFAYDPNGGPDGKGCFLIKADHRDGLAGCWKKGFPATGEKYYHFRASFQAHGVAVPRRSVVAEIHWADTQGKKVPLDHAPVSGYLPGMTAMAETEFPATEATDAQGWTKVLGTYRAPRGATQALVELHLRWAADAEVRWGSVTWTEVSAPPPRKVRLATVHFMPHGGKSPQDNCRMYEPLIADAARQKADLWCSVRP